MEDYRTKDFILREYEGVIVVRFTAENLTAINDLDRITAELNALVDDRGVRKLVVDFKHVKYISSAALGLLIALNKKLIEKEGMLVLSHPETIAELLRVSRTEKLFKMAADPREAARMLQ